MNIIYAYLEDKADLKSQFQLAIILIIPAFLLIAAMLFLQYGSTANFIEIVKKYDEPPTDAQTSNIIKIIQEVDKSNQTIFNILLPVFGAWIGAVVAYFFGAAAQKKTQDSIEKIQQNTQEGIKAVMKFGRLEPNTTIRELINDYVDPKDREIIKCVFEDKIKNVNEEIRKHGNIVVHENDIPKGILYTGDLSASDEELNDKLGDFIEKKKPVDKITGKKWTKNGVENYAVISYKHTLSEAKT